MSADTAVNPPGRLVKLVLVTPEGELLGCLAPFPVATPWWQNAWDVVRGAQEHHGVQVTLLRLLEADRPSPPGGSVTYLAEVDTRVPAEPWNGKLDEHPLRCSWARPSGPATDLAWADAALAVLGVPRIGPPEQVRTWNLSSLWRLPVEGQTVWLKVVPPFFAHEGPLLERLQGGSVPTLLDHHGGRLLLAQVPGEDLYEPPRQVLLEMVTLLVGLQREWIDRTDELLALGLPDWGAPSLIAAMRPLMEHAGAKLSGADNATLATFVDGLDDRFAAVGRCGLPDTLVHGDFHPGNHRGDATTLVLIDWGDSGVGHPLLDEPAFFDHVSAENASAVRVHWHREWRAALPGSDPDRASKLLAPIAAARRAVIYQRFLESIEPSERPYHQADPTDWLHRTATLVRSNA